jgi:hypothetical protein
MLRKTFACLLIAGLGAVAAAAQTADQLVEKNIQAKGGRDALNAVKTIRMTGTMSMEPGLQAPVVMEMAPPAHKVRLDITVQGLTGTQAYDGAAGWQVMPFMGKTEPEALVAEDLDEIRANADFAGPLFDYRDKGNRVEYLGKGDLEGKPVQKLRLTEKNGDVTAIYLDAASYLELKEETTRTVHGQPVDLETVFGDYKPINGVVLPYSVEIRAKGKPGSQVISLDKIEINPDIPVNRFDMPKQEKKPDAPAPSVPPKP